MQTDTQHGRQTVQLKTITNAKELPFGGIEFVKTDKQITEVIIGGKLRIRKGESYNAALKVLVEAPYEEVKKHRLTATIDGFDPKVSYHDSKYDAECAGNPLEDKGASIKVEEVTVHVDDAGNVVAPISAQEAAPDLAEIPF